MTEKAQWNPAGSALGETGRGSSPSSGGAPTVREIRDVLNELERLVEAGRQERNTETLTIKDLRRTFDQESAKMNQAIFNDQHDQIRETCLKTVLPLLEILARA